MTRNEFKRSITRIAKSARDKLVELKAKEKTLSAKYADFSPQYIREKLEPQIDEVRREIRKVCDEAQREAAQVVNEYSEDLRKADALNPADLNDDIRLLNCGVSLKERDLKDMLARNNGNRTMTQLILRYADERKINTGVHYVRAETEAANLRETVENVLGVGLRHPENEHAFNQLFGPGTPFYTE